LRGGGGGRKNGIIRAVNKKQNPPNGTQLGWLGEKTGNKKEFCTKKVGGMYKGQANKACDVKASHLGGATPEHLHEKSPTKKKWVGRMQYETEETRGLKWGADGGGARKWCCVQCKGRGSKGGVGYDDSSREGLHKIGGASGIGAKKRTHQGVFV